MYLILAGLIVFPTIAFLAESDERERRREIKRLLIPRKYKTRRERRRGTYACYKK